MLWIQMKKFKLDKVKNAIVLVLCRVTQLWDTEYLSWACLLIDCVSYYRSWSFTGWHASPLPAFKRFWFGNWWLLTVLAIPMSTTTLQCVPSTEFLFAPLSISCHRSVHWQRFEAFLQCLIFCIFFVRCLPISGSTSKHDRRHRHTDSQYPPCSTRLWQCRTWMRTYIVVG